MSVPYRAHLLPDAKSRSAPDRTSHSVARRPPRPASSPAARPAPATSLPRTETAARRADALARSLCAARDRLTEPLARLAASLVDERAWCSMGFARAADFAREHLGRSARWLRDLATLHRGLSTLAGLASALTGEDAGAPIGRRRALLVARVADASTLAAWLDRARSLTVRELQEEVARALQAGAPISCSSESDPKSPSDPRSSSAASDPRSPSASDPAVTPTPAATSLSADLDDGEDRSLVRVAAPRAVVATFDEAVDLYRAVEGADATVSSFIEALVAEATAAGAPPAFDECAPIFGAASAGSAHAAWSAPPVGNAPPAAIIETALARSTDRWRHLPRSIDASWGLALGHSTLARLDVVVRAGAGGTAAERLARMKDLLAIENEIEIHLGRLLASMGEQDAWNRLRFDSMAHYAEERLGLSRTAAQTRARAARALGRFPLLRDAYEHDAIGLEAALLVGRVLSAAMGHDAGSRADFESAWVGHASEVTFKRLRDEERALSRFAAFFPACATMTGATRLAATTPPVTPPATTTAPPDDADWHASLRREPGIARRRVAALGLIALGVRPAVASDTPGAEFDPSTALIPEPDVFLRLTLPDDLAGRFLAAVEAARRDLTVQAESVPWDLEWPPSEGPSPTPALLAARMFSTRSRRVPAWVGLLAMIEDFVATWDPHEDVASGAGHRKGGASRDPSRAPSRAPSREDAILIRDGWRCAAPACTSRRNLEVHHVIYRSRGGGDQEWNLVTLCRFHHQRGEHGGLARCEGRAPLGLTWRLGAAQAATWYRNERRIATLEPGIIDDSRAETSGRAW